ncbi:hypothetical protein BOTBODRAFT_424077 [Botryobasidium botryosum FD-172 SS1]|uniref:Uncharacterized protein n=1 Tax=Botryobasidium botryosum (strain FD-172 SS1) TaxID=930990 RepID=A0A067M935_BOTB1|nr:hypothetical protein BOTBODRAFT_424077 [Botryobasidium botryosum FD-172 SS1]
MAATQATVLAVRLRCYYRRLNCSRLGAIPSSGLMQDVSTSLSQVPTRRAHSVGDHALGWRATHISIDAFVIYIPLVRSFAAAERHPFTTTHPTAHRRPPRSLDVHISDNIKISSTKTSGQSSVNLAGLCSTSPFCSSSATIRNPKLKAGTKNGGDVEATFKLETRRHCTPHRDSLPGIYRDSLLICHTSILGPVSLFRSRYVLRCIYGVPISRCSSLRPGIACNHGMFSGHIIPSRLTYRYEARRHQNKKQISFAKSLFTSKKVIFVFPKL